MSFLLVSLCLTLLTGVMVLHVQNENNLSKRIVKAGTIVEQLLDQNGIKHIDLKKKFASSSLSTQLRLVEYYINYLDSNYTDFGSKKTVFQRINNIESALSLYKDYNTELKLAS
ncbi:hypothetical protein [Marinifilum fragile]|jgi:hypothetical protein|uniref:hypothetical protein n=1 Tax=Marinifilum fragile TaxID=570161 RepID=UPI002AA6C001|nr:hypothetical protein [Marinifilum fragile]